MRNTVPTCFPEGQTLLYSVFFSTTDLKVEESIQNRYYSLILRGRRLAGRKGLRQNEMIQLASSTNSNLPSSRNDFV